MDFEWNPIAIAMQYTIHFISEQTSYEPELSDFKDQSISDWVQTLGNIIIWWEESFGGFCVKSNCKSYPIHHPLHFGMNFVRTWIVRFQGPIDIGLSPKLGEQRNMVGWVIWWVLSEIQSQEQCIAPTTPFQNELHTNLNCPISWTNRYQIESNTWGTS